MRNLCQYVAVPSQGAVSPSKASGATRASARRSGSFAVPQSSPAITASKQPKLTLSDMKDGKLTKPVLEQGMPKLPQILAHSAIQEPKDSQTALEQACSSKKAGTLAQAVKKARFAESTQGSVPQPQEQGKGYSKQPSNPLPAAQRQGTATESSLPSQAAQGQGATDQQPSGPLDPQLHILASTFVELQTMPPATKDLEHVPVAAGADISKDDAVKTSGLQEANYTWVQCDLCNKWRELPKGCLVCFRICCPSSIRLHAVCTAVSDAL